MFDDQNLKEIPHISQLMLSDPGEVDKWFQGLKSSDNTQNQRKNKNLIDMLPKNIADLEDDRYFIDTDLAQSKIINHDASLKNLQKQPHEYLKKFNSLVNQMSHDTINQKERLNTLPQLEIQPLTKFKLPKYFLPAQFFTKEVHDSQEMTTQLIVSKSDRQDKFINKHNHFVDRTMTNNMIHKKWVKDKNEIAKKQIEDNLIGIFKLENEILGSSSPIKQRLMMTACSPYMLKHINKQSQGYKQYQIMQFMIREKAQVLHPPNIHKIPNLKLFSRDEQKSIIASSVSSPKNFRSPLIQRKSQIVPNLNSLKKLQKIISENEIKDVKDMVLKQPHNLLKKFFNGENGLKKYKDYIQNKNETCIYNYGDYLKAHLEFPSQTYQISEPAKQSILDYQSDIKSFI